MLICSQLIFASKMIPSVYIGAGTGTNIGGNVGLGAELQYHFLSLNLAVGRWADEFPAHTGASSPFDFDVGLKAYAPIGLYAGLNYGIINEEMYTTSFSDLLHFEKTHGFTFSLGYRHLIFSHLYGSGFIGITNDYHANYIDVFPFNEDPVFVPHFGFMLGWQFTQRVIKNK